MVCRRPARKAPTVGSGPVYHVRMCCEGEGGGIGVPSRHLIPHSSAVVHSDT